MDKNYPSVINEDSANLLAPMFGPNRPYMTKDIHSGISVFLSLVNVHLVLHG